jgi:hypothetical protein
VALHPHQTKRKPAAVPSLFFIKELAQLPGNIFPIDLNIRCEKIAMAIYPALNFVCSLTSAHLVLRSENTNASDGTSDVNGFTNVVMAGRQETTCTSKAKLTSDRQDA